ncbi:MAG: PASTA domain-containing protein [Actinobacteria bacterium]|nr:PASTA domain-containing protein [Actinomycetota bacterium]
MGRIRGARPVAAALTAAFLGVALIGFAPTLNPLDLLLGRGRPVVLDDVVGLPVPGVRSELLDAGLDVQTTSAFSLNVPRGAILAQDPLPGARLEVGSKVTLSVSRGAVRVVVGDLVGSPLADARRSLDEAGVVVEVEERPDAEVPAGTVLAQDPGPGLEVRGDGSVRLVVSTGPPQRPVPEVDGRSLAVASYALGAFGLEVVSVRGTLATELPPGAVVRTEPAAGTVVAEGTPVTVIVAGDAPPTPVPAVLDQDAAAAADRVRSSGFEANVVTATPDEIALVVLAAARDGRPPPELLPGRVIIQTPEVGAEARPASVVTLVVAP